MLITDEAIWPPPMLNMLGIVPGLPKEIELGAKETGNYGIALFGDVLIE
ncbi:MAG: hypothetical protein WCG94_01000 [Methanothrix sp.]